MTTVGCDPEFTILDPKGKPVPAHQFGFPTKHEPRLYAAEFGTDKTAIRDGYNVEVNVPGNTCRALMINDVRNVVQGVIGPRLPKGYTLAAKAAFRIRLRTQMREAPDDVKMFGCDPSWDAYTGQQKVCSIDASTHPWRYAGGHLHFGTAAGLYGDKAITDPKNHRMLVKLFDLYIGIPLSVIFTDDGQWQRRKYYGQAGEFRPQQYNPSTVGIEYRVPPPELFNHPALVTLFTGVGRYVVQNFAALKSDWNPMNESDVIRAINTGKGADKLLRAVNGFYSPSTILALRDVEHIHKFYLPTMTHDAHVGWTEYATTWKLSLA